MIPTTRPEFHPAARRHPLYVPYSASLIPMGGAACPA